MSQEEDLTQIVFDLPNHWATGGEGMWALPLGDDLFEIRNVPFYAYGVNLGDVVRAVAPSDEEKPVALEHVRAGGHETLRVIFDDATPEDQRPAILSSLADLKTSFEGANEFYFAIDVEADGDVDAVRERLDVLEQQGLLEYETCEPQIEGSFDALPDDE